MRTIEDQWGRRWDVFVGRESYGEMRLLFALHRSSEVRSHVVSGASLLDAERELADLTDGQLRDYLQDGDG